MKERYTNGKNQILQACTFVQRSNGKPSFIWAKRVCAAEEGVVFRVRVLNGVNRVSFLDRRQAVSDQGVWNLSRLCVEV